MNAIDMEKERTAFEAYVREMYPETYLERYATGCYKLPYIREQWKGWKKRAALGRTLLARYGRPTAPVTAPTDTKQLIYDLAKESGAARYPSLSETKIDSLCFDPASFERFCERLLAQIKTPSGWRLVPKEPTNTMLYAAQRAWCQDPLRRTTTLWDAMLAAAPEDIEA